MSSASTHDTRSLAANAAPAISLGVAWAARKGMSKAYEARTGNPAPIIARRDASIMRRILWASAMAATVALVEILIWHLLDPDD
ncbi:MAG: DUF4235 domain-containing protein [Candidatus Nanopelagicales bacterium]